MGITMPGYSGLWDGWYGTPYALTDARIAPFERVFNRMIRAMGNFAEIAIASQIVGAAAGGTATRTHTQLRDKVSAPGESEIYGGLRGISTITDINRATTAADVTNLKNMLGGTKYDLATFLVSVGGTSPPGDITRFN